MSCVRLWGGIKSPRAVLEVVDQRTQLDQTGRPGKETTFADQEEASDCTTHKHTVFDLISEHALISEHPLFFLLLFLIYFFNFLIF